MQWLALAVELTPWGAEREAARLGFASISSTEELTGSATSFENNHVHLMSRENTSSCRTSPKESLKTRPRKKPCKLLTGTYRRIAPRSSPGDELLLLEKPQENSCTDSVHSQPDTSQTC